jgi:hypothetical protein
MENLQGRTILMLNFSKKTQRLQLKFFNHYLHQYGKEK